MTREECERAILDKLSEIKAIYHQYNPNGLYLSMVMNGEDGTHLSVYNSDYPGGEDEDKPLDAWRNSGEDYHQYNHHRAVSA